MAGAPNVASDEGRRGREAVFHDEWAKFIRPEELLVDEAFATATAVDNRYVLGQFGGLHGKRVLDYGCGAAEAGVFFAKQGAKVVGVDVSSGMLETARHLAAHHGVAIETRQVVSERIPADDREFDLVYGNGVLHHVNLRLARPELARVLKDDGKACFLEPLPYNPLINVYRRLAKEVRTPDEKPLTFKDVDQFRDNFASVTHREFWLTTLAVFLKFFLIERVNPNRERYWKKIYTDAARLEPLFLPLSRIDDWLLTRLPVLGRLCWITAITLSQPRRNSPALGVLTKPSALTGMSLRQRLLGAPFVYNHLRPAAVGGIDMSPLYQRVNAGRRAVVLDIGCGTGDALRYLTGFEQYVGVDTDEVAIAFANKRFGSRTAVRFECRRVTAADVTRLNPTHVVMAGLLHHLTDDEALALFGDVRGSNRLERIATSDIIYLHGKWLNNLIARLDRGRYCRTKEAYEALAAGGGLEVTSSDVIRCHPRTGLVWYLIMTLQVRMSGSRGGNNEVEL
jgi:SAM-dependent methyltransferase